MLHNILVTGINIRLPKTDELCMKQYFYTDVKVFMHSHLYLVSWASLFMLTNQNYQLEVQEKAKKNDHMDDERLPLILNILILKNIS